MNLYVLVEGARTEPALYRAWLPQLLPGLTEVQSVEEAADRDRCFFLVSGGGHPSWLKRLNAAAADIRSNEGAFQHLLVCVDAEEEDLATRTAEVEAALRSAACPVPGHALVADCCIETWLLGNRRIMPVQAEPPSAPGDTPDLRALQDWYDVRTLDPEAMPARPPHIMRAHTHLAYLRALFHHRHLTYSKARPGIVTEPAYLEALAQRARDPATNPPHLRSFARLLELPARIGW